MKGQYADILDVELKSEFNLFLISSMELQAGMKRWRVFADGGMRARYRTAGSADRTTY